MNPSIPILLCFVLVIIAPDCGEEPDLPNQRQVAPGPSQQAQNPKGQTDGRSEGKRAGSSGTKVYVAEIGEALNPAIQLDQLPVGVWYCGVDFAHWAGLQKPASGNCPMDGIKLKQHGRLPPRPFPSRRLHAHPHEHTRWLRSQKSEGRNGLPNSAVTHPTH